MSFNIAEDLLSLIGSRVNDYTHQPSRDQQITGYWGNPSSTVDWCEPNYAVTYYIAEFFNTISSLAMVFCGFYGMFRHYNKFFEKRYILAFGSVAVVGIGSAAFHGTLMFSLQMLDELPMIYSALIMAYSLIEHKNKTPKYTPTLPIALFVHAIITTILVASPALAPDYASPLLQFICFHISFAALQTFLITKTTQLYLTDKDEQARRSFQRGIMLWVLALGFWVADYLGCELFWEGENGIRKKYFRWKVPIDWIMAGETIDLAVPNPQLHSWWHICASTGLYMMIIYTAHSRARLKGYKANIKYKMGILPVIDVTVNNEKKSISAKKLKPSDYETSVKNSSEDPKTAAKRRSKTAETFAK